ncbi:MAG: hypothetical protein NVSMB27_16010 [Ktedonobacteraceae bacterium]
MQIPRLRLTSKEPVKPERLAHARLRNLPGQLTPLLGREQEVSALRQLMNQEHVRLLTLTGPGGVGKTRLGLQVASDLLDDFANGVCFVPLAPISEPDLVISTIAQMLGLREAREVGDRSLLERLKVYLQGKQMLLLLDNFEQVVGAASLLVELLAACPGLKALVTSRMILRVRGEQEFPVLPLALPDLKHLPDLASLLQCPAVALFIQRAQASKPDFQFNHANAPTIAKICDRLDGLPLAIELAAARIKLLSPQALLARLEHRLQVLTSGTRDMPERQQTLRNTLTWSYDLLDTQERRLFRQLSVFVGGCTLEAAETICSASGDVTINVLDGVASLLDMSLLKRIELGNDESRVLMLETIREYGLECLDESGEAEITRRAHAAYYLELAEETWPKLFSAKQESEFDRLERELENLRASLHWLVEQAEAGSDDAAMALRLGWALFQFWEIRGHLSGWYDWLERALARSEGASAHVRARGFYVAGLLSFLQGDYAEAEALFEKSLPLYREAGRQSGPAFALHMLGMMGLARNDYALAQAQAEEALALFKEAGDRWSRLGIAFTLDTLVRVAIGQGEYVRARSLAEECLMLTRQVEDQWNMAKSLFHLALLAFSQGDSITSRPLAEECLALSREIGFKWGLAFSLSLLGLLVLQQGDESTARDLLTEALAIRKEVEDRWDMSWGLYCLGWVACGQGEDTSVHALYEKQLSILAALDDKEFMVSSLDGMGRVVAAQGEPSWATRLWGAAESLRETVGLPFQPVRSPVYERAVVAVRFQLSEEAFATAWTEGRAMTPGQAMVPKLVSSAPQSIIPAMPLPTYPAGLTEREVEVLRLVAGGLTTPQIAEQLMVSFHTANAHVRSIYNKLDVTSRSAATRYAVEKKLV